MDKPQMEEGQIRVLMITSEWPTSEHPERAPFIFQQVKFIRQAGVEVDVFLFRGKQNPFNYLIAWLKLRNRYAIGDFDVIHAQFGQSGLLALPATGRLVVTFHGSDLHGFPGRDGHYTVSGGVLRFLSQFVASRAKRVIVVSDHLRDYLPPQTHVDVIPCGVDFDLFKPVPKHDAREKLSLPMDKHFVLFAANPNNPIKRHHLAKEAVGLLQKQFDWPVTFRLCQ
jgi:glycosyltransferase involved in cell wall biosynthesis